MRFLVVSATVMFCLSTAAQVQEAAPAPLVPSHITKGPTVEGITQYTLANGFRVLLFPDASAPTITVNITYLVGSRHESSGERGMAHLLEHLLFKGTPRHRHVPQELAEHGAWANASTYFDRTNYFERVTATYANLAWALELEADRMVHSFVAQEALASEFTVVRNEFEAGENSPSTVLQQRAFAAAFLWHNYGHAPIGARSDIEQAPIARLQAFYHKYYQPDNAILVVAGRFDPPKTLRLIETAFGRIPRPRRSGDLEIYPTYTLDPPQDGERRVILRRAGDAQSLVAVYHVPAGSDADFPAVEVLSQVLGDAPSGRLYTALVTAGLATDVSAGVYRLKEPGVMLASADVRKQSSLDSARVALVGALSEAVQRPPTAVEVERAKAAILNGFDLLLNDSQLAALYLSEWQAMGDWRLLFLYRDRVKQVTPADVERVAHAYLKSSNLTLGEFIPTDKPERAEIPPPPDVAALVRDYKGDTMLVAGEAFDASPRSIEGRVTRVSIGGVKLALLPKRTRGRSVHASLTLRFGTAEALQGRAAAADLAASMLMRGTRSLSRQQIKDSLDRLKAQVTITGSPGAVSVTVETTRPNLVGTLRLVASVLQEPAFNAAEFAELKRQQLAVLEAQRSEPWSLAKISSRRLLTPWPKGDPRYVATIDESIAEYSAATLETARSYYSDFYGASDGTMAVVGDVDPAELTQVVKSMFGEWRSPKRFQRLDDRYREIAAAEVTAETPDKANAVLIAGVNVPLRDDAQDYPALLLANEILGGGWLNSRLATRIRQKEGLSYYVASSLDVSPLDSAGRLTARAIFAPQNAGKVETALRQEIARAHRDGFTAEEVRRARDGLLVARQVEWAQDSALAGKLASNLFVDRTMTYDAEMNRRLSALTAAQVTAAFRKYVDPARIILVRAGDFATGSVGARPRDR